MTADIRAHFRTGLPLPTAAPFEGFPRFNFVGGHNDADHIPVAHLRVAVDKVLERNGSALATYGLTDGPQGHRPLRQFIVDHLASVGGQTDGPDNVLLTSGSLQALDLVNQLLLAPGDVAVVEEASYGGAISRVRKLGVACRGVSLDADGIDPGDLRRVLSEEADAGRPVKFIYTIPTVQNPTGGVMPESRRRELLQITADADCLIFEDDCYADLLWGAPRPPTLRALDAEAAQAEGRANRVIYCGSFSKSVAPALRVGYIVADWPVIAQILPLKTDAGSGALEQMALAEFCTAHFDAHVATLRDVLKKKCDAVISALDENFGASATFDPPLGGIFIWITLPDAVDTSVLATAAAKEGIALNPGAEWTVDGQANRNRLRLCFGNPDIATIREGVARLAHVCHAEFGVPATIANTLPDPA